MPALDNNKERGARSHGKKGFALYFGSERGRMKPEVGPKFTSLMLLADFDDDKKDDAKKENGENPATHSHDQHGKILGLRIICRQTREKAQIIIQWSQFEKREAPERKWPEIGTCLIHVNGGEKRSRGMIDQWVPRERHMRPNWKFDSVMSGHVTHTGQRTDNLTLLGVTHFGGWHLKCLNDELDGAEATFGVCRINAQFEKGVGRQVGQLKSRWIVHWGQVDLEHLKGRVVHFKMKSLTQSTRIPGHTFKREWCGRLIVDFTVGNLLRWTCTRQMAAQRNRSERDSICYSEFGKKVYRQGNHMTSQKAPCVWVCVISFGSKVSHWIVVVVDGLFSMGKYWCELGSHKTDLTFWSMGYEKKEKGISFGELFVMQNACYMFHQPRETKFAA